MFKNHFKTAIRNFSKNKLISVINLLGLSIGISAAIIVFLIIQYDYSFDTYEPGRNNIYRIVQENQKGKLLTPLCQWPGLSGKIFQVLKQCLQLCNTIIGTIW